MRASLGVCSDGAASGLGDAPLCWEFKFPVGIILPYRESIPHRAGAALAACAFLRGGCWLATVGSRFWLAEICESSRRTSRSVAGGVLREPFVGLRVHAESAGTRQLVSQWCGGLLETRRLGGVLNLTISAR